MSDNLPEKGEKPTPRSLDEMDEELPPVSGADEVVQLNVRVRKNVRKELGKMKIEKEENIEDLVDEALRDYIKRHE